MFCIALLPRRNDFGSEGISEPWVLATYWIIIIIIIIIINNEETKKGAQMGVPPPSPDSYGPVF